MRCDRDSELQNSHKPRLQGAHNGVHPAAVWEAQAAEPFVAEEGAVHRWMRASMSAAGVRVRGRAYREHTTTLQVSGSRTMSVFSPIKSRPGEHSRGSSR